MIMIDFRFTEVPDSAESAVDISTAYVDFPPDHLISPPSSLTYIYDTESSICDPDDDEILSHRPLSPPPESPDVDDDEDTPILSQAVQRIPRSVRLLLPSHIHPAFPGCTPSTPATSQQMPQVRWHLLWIVINVL
jgi:hypothetical protein